jgi:release factor glutamine methyltransferase
LLVGDLLGELECAITGTAEADPRREACDIIATLLDVPRHWPAAHRLEVVDPALACKALSAAGARRRGMPLAYAVGRAAFRLLTLQVDERVLIPRPETEGLVDLVLERGLSGGLAIDVGTGSGAIALSLSREGRFDRVIGTDVSTDALVVARHNADIVARSLCTPVEFRAGTDLAPVRGMRARAIVSNPPYISWAEAAALPSSVRDWEPPVALYSGRSGLDATARLVAEAVAILEPSGMLALEVDVRRAEQVAEMLIAESQFTDVVVTKDLFGRERYVTGSRRTGD